MTTHNEDNDFPALESTLRKAFAQERKQGLAADQLRALHEAIDQDQPRKAKPKWWQWSLAGSLLASAVIAIVVVERYPEGEHYTQVTESTSAPDDATQTPLKELAVPAEPAAASKPAAAPKVAHKPPAARTDMSRKSKADMDGSASGQGSGLRGNALSLGGSSQGVANEAGPAPRSTISLAAVTFEAASKATKGTTSSSIKRITAANMPAVQACYNQLLARKPNSRGSMTVTWSIPGGSVKVTGAAIDPRMRQCMQTQVSTWTLPEGTRGQASVTFQLGAD